MPASSAYRTRRRPERTEQTRAKIMGAVRELLAEGTFHEAPVEEVAERAGVARATLYQHYRSRVDLVDAICDTFAVNPALLAIREAVALEDPERALSETVGLCVRFWSSEDAVLGQLYGVAAIDPAAAALVERQRADRRGELERLARNLRQARALPPGTSERRALELLMVLTSYETYRELRLTGLGERQAARTLQDTARTLLIAR
jgi:AcrR family transcriptional regulator